MKRAVFVTFGLWVSVSGCAVLGQTNSWLGADGSWHAQSSWSLNQRPNSGQDIIVTNTGDITVTINDETASSFPSSLTILSLSVSNPAGSSRLLLTNPPTSTVPITLTISNTAVVGAGSVLDVTDSSSVATGITIWTANFVADGSVSLYPQATLSVNSGIQVASAENSTGTVNILGGALIGNPGLVVGENGRGHLVISNGILQAGAVDVGQRNGAYGSWQIAGGSSTVGDLHIGAMSGAVGELVLAGGELTAKDVELGGEGGIQVMDGGVGSLVISNGVMNVNGYLNCPAGHNGAGTVTVAGGNLTVEANLRLGLFASGTLWQKGGEISVTNTSYDWWDGRITLEGTDFDSQLICSGGMLYAKDVDVGGDSTYSSMSLWSIVGGTSTVNRAVYVSGNESDNTVGLLTVSDGRLQTPTLELGGGIITISGGEVQVEQLLDVGDYEMVSKSVVEVAGGQLTVGDIGLCTIGSVGPGQVIVSSGTFASGQIMLGGPFNPGPKSGSGELTLLGGTTDIGATWPGQGLFVGHGVGGTGIVCVADAAALQAKQIVLGETGGAFGKLTVTGGIIDVGQIIVGEAGVGSMQVSSNAEFQTYRLLVGNLYGAIGQASFNGATSPWLTSCRIMDFQLGVEDGSLGMVWVLNVMFSASSPYGCFLPAVVGGQGSGRLSATNSILNLCNLSVGNKGTLECVNSELNVLSDCGVFNNNLIRLVNSTSWFSAPVQNMGTITVDGGTATFSQFVSNDGLIIATNGSVQFLAGITNSGAVVLGPDQFQIASITNSGNDVDLTP